MQIAIQLALLGIVALNAWGDLPYAVRAQNAAFELIIGGVEMASLSWYSTLAREVARGELPRQAGGRKLGLDPPGRGEAIHGVSVAESN